MDKRNLFEELKQGLQEGREHDQGKLTLRSYEIEKNDMEITATKIKNSAMSVS